MSEKERRRSALALTVGSIPNDEPSRKQSWEVLRRLTASIVLASASEESFSPSGVRTQNQAPFGMRARISSASRRSPSSI